MGQLRNANLGDKQAFPGCTYAINNSPPNTQCQEADLVANNSIVTAGLNTITKLGAFVGIDLTGKEVTVFIVPPPDRGPWQILSNTDDVLIVNHIFIFSAGNGLATCTDVGQVYLTRNESSFARFLQSESQPYTIKGGQLFTSSPDPPMGDACSDIFAPL